MILRHDRRCVATQDFAIELEDDGDVVGGCCDDFARTHEHDDYAVGEWVGESKDEGESRGYGDI